MDETKKKKIAKETAKALGVAGASAAIGAAYLGPKETIRELTDVAYPDSPLDNLVSDIVYGKEGLLNKIDENPNLGVGINAAASGIGGLAAYGLLKGGKAVAKKVINSKTAGQGQIINQAVNSPNIKANNS